MQQSLIDREEGTFVVDDLGDEKDSISVAPGPDVEATISSGLDMAEQPAGKVISEGCEGNALAVPVADDALDETPMVDPRAPQLPV